MMKQNSLKRQGQKHKLTEMLREWLNENIDTLYTNMNGSTSQKDYKRAKSHVVKSTEQLQFEKERLVEKLI